MSDIQVLMKFELLSNEILFECFEFLNAIDIFHSFDQLNSRFNNLIRSMRLHLNFQNVSKSICEQFCMKMFSNEIKNQIYSLHLSNDKDTCYPIESFLEEFSLDDFVYLRSLTLSEVKKQNLSQLQSNLPSLSQLFCFRLFDPRYNHTKLLCSLTMSQLRTLIVPQMCWDLDIMHRFSSITDLTIVLCEIHELFKILKYAPKLKHFTIEILYESADSSINEEIYFPNLKQLTIMEFFYKFDKLAMMLNKISNLKSLTIFSDKSDGNMIDACKWEYLITSSLPQLIVFKFQFVFFRLHSIDHDQKKLKKFQSDFWIKQHHWYTEYSLSKDDMMIYTIPFAFNKYTLSSETTRYCDELMDNTNTFQNVKNLISGKLSENSQYEFFYATTLTLGEDSEFVWKFSLGIEDVEYLKIIMNFSNIKHLTVSKFCMFEKSFVLLEILKKAPQLSSISMFSKHLLLSFDDDELCRYLNKMIRKLEILHDVYEEDLLNNFNKINQFCQIFRNIDQLVCCISTSNRLLYLLEHLPNLSYIKVHHTIHDFFFEVYDVKAKLQKIGIKIIIAFKRDTFDKELSIWISDETPLECIQLLFMD